jgi:hypothetical protein
MAASEILDELVEKKIVEQEVVLEEIRPEVTTQNTKSIANESFETPTNYHSKGNSANTEIARPDNLKSFVEKEDLIQEKAQRAFAAARKWQFVYLLASPVFLAVLLLGLYLSPWKAEIENQVSDKVSNRIIAMIKGLDRYAFSGSPVLGEKTGIDLAQIESLKTGLTGQSAMYSTVNLLQNPGFEAGPAPQTALTGFQPKGWQYWGTSTSSDTFVSGYSIRSGGLGLFFNGLKHDYIKKTDELGVYQSQTKTTNGRDYSLSAWIRVTEMANVRLGFFGEADKRDPNFPLMNSSQWSDYGKDVSKNFTVSQNGKNNSEGVVKEGDWNLVSFNYSNAALGKIPYISISGISGQRAFIDDVSLVEVAPSYVAGREAKDRVISSLSITRLGNSSVLVDDSGKLYPVGGDLGSGSLGTAEHAFGALYLAKTSVDGDGNLTTAGSAIINGNLSVDKGANVSGDLSVGGTLSFATATISGTLGVGKDASIAGKINLDSTTSQINATNNRPIQLGFMNTGRVELLSASNYIDLSGNLDISGVYKVAGTAGVNVGTNSCVTSVGGIVTGTGSCPGGGRGESVAT